MVKVVIVDDEKKAVQNLQNILASRADVEVVGFAHSAASAREVLRNTKIDLLFLDINMPTETGFDLLNSLPNKEFEIIFITAHNDYALKAFKVSAVDYILKPIDIEELNQAIDKVKTKLANKTNNNNAQFNDILEMINKMQAEQEIEKISLPYLGGFKLVPIADIMYIEGDGNYSTIFLVSGEKIVVTKQIGAFEDVMPVSKFNRIHRSTMVNLKYVTGYSSAEGNVAIMQDGSKLSVSRRKLDDFLKAVNAAI